MTERKLVSFDWAIKKLLRSKANFSILEGFLSELIAPSKDLKIIKILESESNKETKEDKSNRVDILVELEPGELVLIEVQVTRELDYFHRMLYGTSKIITEYLDQGQPYEEIKKVYSVNILYFDLGQGDDYLYKGTTEFIGVHTNKPLRLCRQQINDYKKKTISEIYPEYYLIKVNKFDDLAKNTLDEWIYFLKNEEIKSDFHAKGLLKAKAEFDILKLPAEERKAYDRYKNNLHYEASLVVTNYKEGLYDGLEKGKAEGKAEGLQEGIKKGKAEGLQEGLEKGRKQIALNMLNNKIAIETIVIATGLTEQEINKLK